jgi:hemoglobin
MSGKKPSLFEDLGGRSTLEKVHKIFYDKIYADPWLGQFFHNIKQDKIESQQTDFMSQSMGGPEVFNGVFPVPAHRHMNISPELFNYRHEMLKASLAEAGVRPELAERWLKIDAAFRNGIVKRSRAECQKRYHDEEILDFPDPRKKAA